MSKRKPTGDRALRSAARGWWREHGEGFHVLNVYARPRKLSASGVRVVDLGYDAASGFFKVVSLVFDSNGEIVRINDRRTVATNFARPLQRSIAA